MGKGGNVNRSEPTNTRFDDARAKPQFKSAGSDKFLHKFSGENVALAQYFWFLSSCGYHLLKSFLGYPQYQEKFVDVSNPNRDPSSGQLNEEFEEGFLGH